MQQQQVDCRVYQEANGKRLVFTIKETTTCVGEIYIAADERYLRTIAQMFSHWVGMVRPNLSCAVRNIINGAAINRGHHD